MEQYIVEENQEIIIDDVLILLEKGDIIISKLNEETDNNKKSDKDYPDDLNYMYVINVKNKDAKDDEFKPHGSPFSNEQKAKDKKSELEHDLDNRDKDYEIQKLRK
jgi:hypothetical protein